MTETRKLSFAERFAAAYETSMKEENEEAEMAPKVFKRGEGLVDVVDSDDKHFG